MSETEAAPDASASAEAAPKAQKSKVMPIILVFNTLLMGAVLFFVLKKPAAAPAGAAGGAGEHAAPAAPAEHAAPAASSEHAPSAGQPGPIVKLDNFIIQLRSVDSERYARVAFDLELGAAADEDVVKLRLSQIRDAVIAYLSDRTYDELRGSEGMERTKATLLKRLDEIVPHRIRAVFISDFIVQ